MSGMEIRSYNYGEIFYEILDKLQNSKLKIPLPDIL